MKLDYKNICLAGLAFLAICAFWQMYDNIIPLILTNTFKLNETYSGVIMAADNVLAVFMLPLFGKISDGTHTKLGRRIPYILGGTIVAAILVNILPAIDNGFAAGTKSGFFTLPAFVIVLATLLIVMSVYRSPAVALMPDITPKPLRAKGNALVNLMGAAGGIIYLAFAAVMYSDSKTKGLVHVNYAMLFAFMSAIMLVTTVILVITVRENKLYEKNLKMEAEHPEWNLSVEDEKSGNNVLPKDVKKSLIFLLLSIGLWYIAYNAVTTWFTTYISSVMGSGIGGASTCFMIASVGAIISYIPVGQLSVKIGRKKSILIGVGLITCCYLVSFFLTTKLDKINVLTYIIFALIGVGWATINVNSLPMVVDMAKGSDVGKFTGYYYTASMIGQVITPVLAGTLMRHIDYKVLFIYSTIFSILSGITMIFVKHGDTTVDAAASGLEAFADME